MSKRHAHNTPDENPPKRRRCEANDVESDETSEQRADAYRTCVLSMCRMNQQEALGEVLSSGVFEFAPDARNVGAAGVAAREGRTKCTLPLPWDVCDETGVTTLMICADLGHVECLVLLLEAGAGLDVVSPGGMTALLHAAKGSFGCLSELITRGACLTAVDSDGDTALHQAAKSVHNDVPDIVRLLLKHGASTEVVNNEGCTPLYMAIEHKNDTCAVALLEGGACMDVRDDRRPPFHEALLGGLALCAERFVARGVSASEPCSEGVSPIAYAALGGSVAAGELLLQHGASVYGETDTEGITPLMDCCSGGHGKFASFLLRHGADVDCSAQNGNTALHSAVESGDADLCKMLLEHGVPLDAQNTTNGWTAVASSFLANPEVCQVLIDAGAQLDVTSDNVEFSSLLSACLYGELWFVKMLLDSGVQLSLTDGGRCLIVAAGKGYLETVRYLLGQGVDVNYLEGNTALHYAAQEKCIDVVLLQHGAEKTLRDDDGETALERVIRIGGCLECCRLLS